MAAWSKSFLCGLALLYLASAVFAFAGGDGSPASPYLISNCTELQNMSANLTASYALNNSIDCAYDTRNPSGALYNGGQGFAPVGDPSTKFAGTFDGQNHTITGLYINRPSTDDIGLFGYTSNASIRNAGLVNISISGEYRVGGLIGSGDYSNVSSSYSSGNVTGTYAGGLIGRSDNVALNNSYSTGNVDGDDAGGLIGNCQYSTVSNSYSTGNITTFIGPGFGGIGGLISYSFSCNVSNSYSTGNMTSYSYVGGLIGSGAFGTVSNSYSTGNVNGGGNQVGGLMGSSSSFIVSSSYSAGTVNGSTQIGGLIGYSVGASTVSNSYSTGNVTGINYTGGLIGDYSGTGNITNSYSTGSVTGINYTGGLIGQIYSGDIYNSFSAGRVNASTQVGGLIGHSDWFSTSNSYWDIYRSNQSDCIDTGSASGCTGANDNNSQPSYFYLKGNAPLSSWDFANVWLAHMANYPTLRAFPAISVFFASPATNSTAYANQNYIVANATAIAVKTTLNNLTIRLYNSTGAQINITASATGPLFVNWTGLADGAYFWNATANSTNGTFDATETRNVTIDTVNPSIRFSSPTDNSSATLNRSYVQINVTASDTNLKSIENNLYNSNGTLIASYYNSTTGTTGILFVNWSADIIILPDGLYYFNATAVDMAGNTNSTETRNVTVDAQPPEVALAPPTPQSSSLLNFQNAAINVTLNEDASQCTLFILSSSNLWTNIRHLNITGGRFDFNASIGVNNYSSFNMLNRNPIAAGNAQTCYLLSNGNSTCYGYTPYYINNYSGGDAVAIGTGASYVCYVLSNGNSACFGEGSSNFNETTNYTGGDAIAVDAGNYATCYLLRNGNSACYGYSGFGAVNYTGGNAIAVSVGALNACYLLNNGNSVCYGGTNYTGGNAIAVASGYSHNCYLLSNGNSKCYGDNTYGQSTNYTGGDAIAVSAGNADTTCYLLSSGNSICYGYNVDGHANAYTGGNAIAVSVGNSHTCYLLSNGTSICYGSNSNDRATNHTGDSLMMPFAETSTPPSSYSMFVNNANGDTTANTTLPVLSDGIYSFFVNCTDTGGNTNSTEMRSVTIDMQAPMITVTSPGGSIDSNSFTLSFTVNDTNLDRCWYSLDNGTNVALPNCTGRTVSSAYGSHCVTVYANDTAGNLNSSQACFNLYRSHVSSPTPEEPQPSPPPQNQTLPLHLSASVICVPAGMGDATVTATSNGSAVPSVALAIPGIGETSYTDSGGKVTFPGLLDGEFTVSGTKDGYDSAQTAFSVSCAPNVSMNATPPQPNITTNQTGGAKPGSNQTGGTKPPSGGGVIEQPQGNLSQANVSVGPSNVTSNATAQPGQNQTVEIGGGILGALKTDTIISQAMSIMVSASKSPAIIASTAIVAAGIAWYVFRVKKIGQAPRQ